MAYVIKRNTLFLNSTGNMSVENPRPVLFAVMITPSSANSRFVLRDAVDGSMVIDVRIENVESRYIEFSAFNGIVLSQTFRCSTFSRLNSVILYGNWHNPVG